MTDVNKETKKNLVPAVRFISEDIIVNVIMDVIADKTEKSLRGSCL